MDSKDDIQLKRSKFIMLGYAWNGRTYKELAPRFDSLKRFKVSLIFSKATCLKSFRILHGGNQWR